MKQGNACGGKDPGWSCPAKGDVVSTTETQPTTDTVLRRIAWLSAGGASTRFVGLMHLFNQESLAACLHELDGRTAVGGDGISTNPYIDANGSILSLLPELGTMGSKWGGAGVTRSSTS